jgi:hypothetical protein
MTGVLQPLDQKFAIVDPAGRPTDYFIRWAQTRQIDITDGITLQDLIDYLTAHTLQEGSGIQITPDGDINNSPAIAADAQEILDQISATRGTIIYRGLLGWAALAPGTATYLLQTNGAGADPTWVAPPAGSGGTIIDIGAPETAPITSAGAAASKSNIVKPLRNMSVNSLFARMFSKIIGATYTAEIATLSTATGYTIGAILATSNTYTATTVDQEWIELSFATPVALIAGTRYALIITRSGVAGATVLTISTPGASGNVYYPSFGGDTALTVCGFASYSAANPPIAGTVALSSGTPGAYGIGVKYT